MLELYTWATPNGTKASIMLEEIGIPYNVHPVNLGKNEQRTAEFLAITPNGRIPAIIDSEGPGGKPLKVFESGAILIYLAEKTGKLMPRDPARRIEAIQWLMFQMGGRGSDVRASRMVQAQRLREPAGNHALHRRDCPAGGRPRPAPGRGRIPGGRILDRGHREFHLGRGYCRSSA
jgi:glutathione S-transferase